MHIGNIVRIIYDKKYGSIRSQSGEEVHFHEHCLWNVKFDELINGQEVEFEVQSSRKGRLGFHIRPHIK